MTNARKELTKVLNGFNVQLEDNKNVIETKDRNCFTNICNALTDRKIPFVGYGYGETAENVTYGMKILDVEKSGSEDNMNMNCENGQTMSGKELRTMLEKEASPCKMQCCLKAGCRCSKTCLQKPNKRQIKLALNDDDLSMGKIDFKKYDDKKLTNIIIQSLEESTNELSVSEKYDYLFQLMQALICGEYEMSNDGVIYW